MYAGGIPFLETGSANMIDEGLHPAKLPWSHSGLFDTFDHSRWVFISSHLLRETKDG
jgi:hypothetical protein